MPILNEQIQQSAVASAGWQIRIEDRSHREAAQFLSKLDFRHISNHLSQKRPGYYLILLRNEIRHRTLREKPALVG